MCYEENMREIEKSMENLRVSGIYDVDKYACSLKHQTSQLEFFYCNLVKDQNFDETFYYLNKRPKEGQIAYFNIGRGFPKELMDGHWCYILKDLGYKAIVIPTTSIKEDSKECNEHYEMDILVRNKKRILESRIQLSEIRSVDLQRIDSRKRYRSVVTPRQEILEFVRKNLFE